MKWHGWAEQFRDADSMEELYAWRVEIEMLFLMMRLVSRVVVELIEELEGVRREVA